MNTETERKLESFVNQNVFYNVSHLVSELVGAQDSFPDYYDDLSVALDSPPDYEGALFENGIEAFTDEHGTECWRDPEDNMTWAGTAQDACEAFGIDAYEHTCEIAQHFIVSEYLADRLEAHGERVLRDFFGMTVWGRTCGGQAISMDHVIQTIFSEV